MDWYYSVGQEKRGPVGQEEMDRLIRARTISASTLVWQNGWPDWRTLENVEAFADGLSLGDARTLAEDEAVCAYSGGVRPKREMVPYGDGWVSPEHKEAFLQEVMEGGETSVYVGFWWRVLGAVVDGAVLLIPSLIVQIPYMLSVGSLEERLNRAIGNGDLSSVLTPGMVLAGLLAIIGKMAIDAFYQIWMVGKYEGTVGKLVIGAKVVRPDGSRVSYKRATGRWAVKNLLNGTILGVATGVPLGLIVAAAVVTAQSASPGAGSTSLLVIAMASMIVLYPLGLFPFWMCAFDKEKRTLHDRIAATRVIRK